VRRSSLTHVSPETRSHYVARFLSLRPRCETFFDISLAGQIEERVRGEVDHGRRARVEDRDGLVLESRDDFLARTQILRMARHAGDAAHVDAGGRQDPAQANAARQSLVERAAVRFRAGSDDVADVL